MHQAGNLPQAEAIYRRILAANDKHPQATHFLGVIALQVGRTDVAIQLLEQAVRLNAGVEAAGNLGVAYRQAGRLADARNLLQQVVVAAPQFGDAWANLADACWAMGDRVNAATAASRALALNPNQVTALLAQANVSQDHGKLDDAIDQLERVISLQPNHVVALTQLGLLLRHRKSYERSIRLLKAAIQLAPTHAEAHGHLAMSLVQKGDFAEGIASAMHAVEVAPQVPQAHSTLAEVYLAADQWDNALHAARRAVEINPNFVNGWGILSLVQDRLDDIQGLVASLEKAVSLSPNHPEAAANLGRAYSRDRQDSKAIATLQAVLARNPNNAEAHGSLAFAYLAAGDLKRGFEEYEWRWNCGTFTTAPRDFDRPMWQGSDPNGRTILVHSEQGYGDVIQFARYLPLLAKQGAHVIVECPLPLRELIEMIPGVTKVVPNGLKLPDFDLHLPLLSLPRAYRSELETIPNTVPYLNADAKKSAYFKDRLGELRPGLKVALMWAGNRKPDPKRTCPLIEFAPLAEIAGVQYISLQKDDAATEIESVAHGLSITNLAPELKSFADTAALLQNVDLLLTIDTGCCHLGGALGVKTWTLLPFMADWRWLRDRSDSPWYPTMRLFRQSRPNNWKDVILNVKAHLQDLANPTNPTPQ